MTKKLGPDETRVAVTVRLPAALEGEAVRYQPTMGSGGTKATALGHNVADLP